MAAQGHRTRPQTKAYERISLSQLSPPVKSALIAIHPRRTAGASAMASTALLVMGISSTLRCKARVAEPRDIRTIRREAPTTPSCSDSNSKLSERCCLQRDARRVKPSGDPENVAWLL